MQNLAVLRSAAGGEEKADEIYGSDSIIKFITTGIRAPRACGIPEDEREEVDEDRRGQENVENAHPLLLAQFGHSIHPHKSQTRQAHHPRARDPGKINQRAHQYRSLHLLLILFLYPSFALVQYDMLR